MQVKSDFGHLENVRSKSQNFACTLGHFLTELGQIQDSVLFSRARKIAIYPRPVLAKIKISKFFKNLDFAARPWMSCEPTDIIYKNQRLKLPKMKK